MEKKETIRQFIIEYFLSGSGEIKDDDSLFEAGIIDSLSLLELIAFIEKTYGISISMSQITISNFDSINKIYKLIKGSKRKGIN